jgi:hypothetical protein
MKACEPAATPSINALKIPEANAKNAIRYITAATVTTLEVFGEREELDKGYVKNKSKRINHINQSTNPSIKITIF